MRAQHLVFLLAMLAAVVAIAAEGERSKSPYQSARTEQYTRTVVPSKFWGVGNTVAGDTEVLTTHSATNTAQLWEWGSQATVSCVDSRTISAHREGCVACWVQTKTSTTNLGGTVSISGYTVYRCDDGCGYVTDDGGNSGHGACTFIPSGGTTYMTLYPSLFAESTNQAATWRNRSCRGATINPRIFNGHPCDANADCGGGATCVALGGATWAMPDGAYLSLTFTSSTVTARVTNAR